MKYGRMKVSYKAGKRRDSNPVSRKNRRAYTKCRKHYSCRDSVNSIWRKR
jgi:hypothetical protein